MLIGPLMFFAETCPVTIRHSICTVRADISQVFCDAQPERIRPVPNGARRRVPAATSRAPSSSVIPSRPIGRPPVHHARHGRYDTQSRARPLDFDGDRRVPAPR